MNKSYILTRYVKAMYYVCTSQFTCYVLTIQYWSRGKSPSIEKRRSRSLSLSLEIFPCKMLFLLWVPSTDEWWSSVASVEVMTNRSQQPGKTFQLTVVFTTVFQCNEIRIHLMSDNITCRATHLSGQNKKSYRQQIL